VNIMKALPRTTVCIDVRTAQLAMIAVRRSAIQHWAVLPAPLDLATDASPDAAQAVASVLRDCLATWGISHPVGRLSISDDAVIMRAIQLPPMRRRDVRPALEYALDREIPFPAEKSVRSWSLTGRNDSHLDVLLAAAWRDVVDRYVEAARLAGVKVELIEPRSLGVARALHGADAVVVEAVAGRLHALRIGMLPGVAEQMPFNDSPAALRATIDELLALIGRRSAARNQAAPAHVFMAGDLEHTAGTIGFPGEPASVHLNGSPPRRPAGFQAGHYLAAIGLAMADV